MLCGALLGIAEGGGHGTLSSIRLLPIRGASSRAIPRWRRRCSRAGSSTSSDATPLRAARRLFRCSRRRTRFSGIHPTTRVSKARATSSIQARSQPASAATRRVSAGLRRPEGFLRRLELYLGMGENRILREAIGPNGGAVVAERYFPVGCTEFGQVIETILAARPSFVFNTLIGDPPTGSFAICAPPAAAAGSIRRARSRSQAVHCRSRSSRRSDLRPSTATSHRVSISLRSTRPRTTASSKPIARVFPTGLSYRPTLRRPIWRCVCLRVR